MIICDQLGLIYLAVPRTASTTISRAIVDAFPDSRKLGHHRMKIPAEDVDRGYLVIAGVRNPYERMASHYLHRHRHHVKNVSHWTFHEYIQHLVNDQLGWFGLAADPPASQWLAGTGCKQVLRLESLQADWAALPIWEKAGFIPRLARRNASTRALVNWRQMYTRELAEKVHEHQAADFGNYGYHPDSWKLGWKPSRARIQRAA